VALLTAAVCQSLSEPSALKTEQPHNCTLRGRPRGALFKRMLKARLCGPGVALLACVATDIRKCMHAESISVTTA
jgi:hypothetical protein